MTDSPTPEPTPDVDDRSTPDRVRRWWVLLAVLVVVVALVAVVGVPLLVPSDDDVAPRHGPTTPPSRTDSAERYDRARAACEESVRDELPQPTLVTVDPSNRDQWAEGNGESLVRVVTWTDWDGYQPGRRIDSLARDVWVTAVPRLARWCQRHPDATPERLAALLGLEPGSTRPFVVELHVRPQDLFRPAFNPRIDDGSVHLQFTQDVERRHRDWLLAEIARRQETGEPFTALGYTYDWMNPQSPVGLSEFVVRQGAAAYVADRTPTADYLQHHQRD